MSNGLMRRYTLLFVSLIINAFGVVFITKAALGTSPISSVPYVLSLTTPLSFGFYTFLLNVLMVMMEILLMGRREVQCKRMELLTQIPVVIIFSSSVDMSMYVLRDFVPTSYPEMLLSLFLGCLIISIGIGWAIKANVAMNPGEYIVRVICARTHKQFGNIKLCLDVTLAITAILLSIALLHNVTGLREGTLVAALFVGPMVRLLLPAWRIFDRWLYAE
jgi:uncharacterized membrane protein YczE